MHGFFADPTSHTALLSSAILPVHYRINMLLNDGTCSLWATGIPTVTPAPCTGPPTLHTRKRPHLVQDVTYSKVGNLL